MLSNGKCENACLLIAAALTILNKKQGFGNEGPREATAKAKDLLLGQSKNIGEIRKAKNMNTDALSMFAKIKRCC